MDGDRVSYCMAVREKVKTTTVRYSFLLKDLCVLTESSQPETAFRLL